MTIPVAEQQKQNIMKAVREYGNRLFSFIRGRVSSREDAEDILQDVWFQFSNVIDREPIEQTSAWLFRVARNRIIDQYRKQHPVSMEMKAEQEEPGEDLGIGEILAAENASPETAYLRNLFWEELFAALDELPEDQRRVFIQHELEDISFQQIAEESGENINTLISRKRYAVLHLRERLEQLYREIIEQ